MAAGEAVRQIGADEPFERVAGRDGGRRRDRARGGDVDEKSAEQDGRPDLIAEEQEGRECETGGGATHRGAGGGGRPPPPPPCAPAGAGRGRRGDTPTPARTPLRQSRAP